MKLTLILLGLLPWIVFLLGILRSAWGDRGFDAWFVIQVLTWGIPAAAFSTLCLFVGCML
jgi:hypothetical protein